MPQVPVYGDPKVQQGNTPTPSLLAPDVPNYAAKQSQELGNAVMSAGQVLSKVAQNELEQANNARIKEARNATTDYRQAITYGRKDVDDGYLNIRGSNALNRPDGKSLDAEYEEKYKKKQDEIVASLANDAQKKAYLEWADADRTSFKGSIASHMGKELYEYKIQTNKAAIDLDLNEIALNAGDPDIVLQKKESIKQTVADLANIQGMNGLPLEQATAEALTPAHIAVIEQAVDGGDIGYAEEYLRQAKEGKEITREALLHAEKLLSAGDLTVKAQNAAASYISKNNFDFSAALSEAKNSEPGKLRDEIVRRIKVEQADHRNMKLESQRAADEQGLSIYRTKGGYNAIPESVLSRMTPQTAVALKERDLKVRSKTMRSDREIVMKLNLLSGVNPQEFAKLPLMQYSQYLDDADWDRFSKSQAEILAGKGGETITNNQLIGKYSADIKGPDKVLFFSKAEEAIRMLGPGASIDAKKKALSDLRIKGEYKDTFTPISRDFPKYKADPSKGEFVPSE